MVHKYTNCNLTHLIIGYKNKFFFSLKTQTRLTYTHTMSTKYATVIVLHFFDSDVGLFPSHFLCTFNICLPTWPHSSHVGPWLSA